MKTKVYTVRTKNYPTISGLNYTIEESGVAVAGFASRLDAERFAKLLNQEHELCHCDPKEKG